MAIDLPPNFIDEQQQKPKRVNWLRGCLLVIGFIGLVIFALSKLGLITIGAVRITNAYLSTGINEQGTPEPSGNELLSPPSQIICVVTISSPKPILVGVRWFYEEQLFADRAVIVDQRQGFVIEASKGDEFKEGNYRAEVYLTPNGSAVRTLNFSIKGTSH